MKTQTRRTGVIVVVAVVALVVIGLSYLAHQRLIVGRASPETCGEEVAFGKSNVPEQGFAVLDEHGWGKRTRTAFFADGRIVRDGKTATVNAAEMDRLQREIAATGIYSLGSGCYARPGPTPSDESAAHLWLVKDGVAYELAWLGSHEKPPALEESARRLRRVRDVAFPTAPGGTR